MGSKLRYYADTIECQNYPGAGTVVSTVSSDSLSCWKLSETADLGSIEPCCNFHYRAAACTTAARNGPKPRCVGVKRRRTFRAFPRCGGVNARRRKRTFRQAQQSCTPPPDNDIRFSPEKGIPKRVCNLQFRTAGRFTAAPWESSVTRFGFTPERAKAWQECIRLGPPILKESVE